MRGFGPSITFVHADVQNKGKIVQYDVQNKGESLKL